MPWLRSRRGHRTHDSGVLVASSGWGEESISSEGDRKLAGLGVFQRDGGMDLREEGTKMVVCIFQGGMSVSGVVAGHQRVEGQNSRG